MNGTQSSYMNNQCVDCWYLVSEPDAL